MSSSVGSTTSSVPQTRFAQRWAPRLWVLVALLGLGYGLYTLAFHLTTDPLADVHAYYDAATRLNAGRPLYPVDRDINTTQAYFYPPLLAIVFRPFAAVLPFEIVAILWEAVCVASFLLTLYRLGWWRREVWIATGVLAMPIAWSLAVGQAQVPVTLLLTIGSPWAVAMAANLKVLPLLAAVYWVGRREWRPLAVLGGWMAVLFLVQLVLEPAGTIAFFGVTNLSEVGDVNNLSPYAISPALWVVFAAAIAVAALLLARTRAGWAAAVTFSVFAPPRLLAYTLMTLLAALRAQPETRSGLRRPAGSVARPLPAPDR